MRDDLFRDLLRSVDEAAAYHRGEYGATLAYRGYRARAEYRPDDGIFLGHVLGLRDTVVFEAGSTEELEAAFRGAVDDYLAFCAEIGKEPEQS